MDMPLSMAIQHCRALAHQQAEKARGHFVSDDANAIWAVLNELDKTSAQLEEFHEILRRKNEVIRLRQGNAMTRAALILQNSALCDHLELLARQLRLYAQPDDSASRRMVRAALRLARKAKRTPTISHQPPPSS